MTRESWTGTEKLTNKVKITVLTMLLPFISTLDTVPGGDRWTVNNKSRPEESESGIF